VSCQCKCCQAGQRCAHVLVLTPKDNADADRLWRRFAESNTVPGYVNLRRSSTGEERVRREPEEPTSVLTCDDCRRPFTLFTYIADLLTRHKFRPSCPACAGRDARGHEAFS